MRTCQIPNPETPAAMLPALSFFERTYYVEVELTKRDATGNPGIKALALGHDTP